jgi:hypothetical protein
MTTGSYSLNTTVPFPHIPGALQRQYPAGSLFLRALGQLSEDLDIDFFLQPKPLLETQILSRCTQDSAGKSLEPGFFWDLPVGTRTLCLLTIAAFDAEPGQLTLDLRCANRSCGEELEMALSLQEISGLSSGNTQNDTIEVSTAAGPLSFRLPRGRDQLTWLKQSFADEMVAARAMLETLAISENASEFTDSLSDDEVRNIGKTLADSDPLVDFKLHITCPECRAEGIYRLDLGAMALEHLRLSQTRLLHVIHVLASRYHWTETQIITVPSWRRNHYLNLLEQSEA